MSVFQIFSVSRLAQPLDSASIQGLVRRARGANARVAITGCLLYSGRCFAQVLEGEQSAVKRLARRVARDPRHADWRVVGEARRGEREYAGWSMGFLHDVSVDDDLETLLMIPQRSAAVAADVMDRMRPDPVMGALR